MLRPANSWVDVKELKQSYHNMDMVKSGFGIMAIQITFCNNNPDSAPLQPVGL